MGISVIGEPKDYNEPTNGCKTCWQGGEWIGAPFMIAMIVRRVDWGAVHDSNDREASGLGRRS